MQYEHDSNETNILNREKRDAEKERKKRVKSQTFKRFLSKDRKGRRKLYNEGQNYIVHFTHLGLSPYTSNAAL